MNPSAKTPVTIAKVGIIGAGQMGSGIAHVCALAGFDVMLSKDKWGVDSTTERVKKLAKQVGGLVGCEGLDRIASGEIPALVLDCAGAAHNNKRYRGKGILDVHVIPEMAQRRMSYFSVPAHAAHPNAGILYALYVSSPEGQEAIQWEFNGGGLLDYADSRRKPQFDAAARIPLEEGDEPVNLRGDRS